MAGPAGGRTVKAMLLLYTIYAGLLGACFASFAAVLGERIPRGESINGRSRCVCGRQLKSWENVPVIGWLSARGRARCCQARLPVRYLAAEAALGAVWAGAVWTLPWPAAVAVCAGSFAATVGACWQR